MCVTNCSLQSHRHKACAQSGCGLHPCSPHSPSRPTRATQSYSRKRRLGFWTLQFIFQALHLELHLLHSGSSYKFQSLTCHKLAAFGTLDIEQDSSFTLVLLKWDLVLQMIHSRFFLPVKTWFSKTLLRQFPKVCPTSPGLNLRNSLCSELILNWNKTDDFHSIENWFYLIYNFRIFFQKSRGARARESKKFYLSK